MESWERVDDHRPARLGGNKRLEKQVGVISKKLTLKRERFDKTREMRDMKRKKKGSRTNLWRTKIETVEERLER